ncbi:MAG: hypothetical protein N2201_07025 [candidate division WOR-3 bacterium]|nr:hypothetical protein [candidate division WOR-3 bacterium]
MQQQVEAKFNQLSDISELIRQLNKIQKMLTELIKLDKDTLSTKPYDIEKSYLQLKKLYTSPPFSELLAETVLYKNLNDFCQENLNSIEKFKEEFHFALGTRLKELMSDFASVSGQLPILKVKFYTIKFDFANGTASIWWGPQKELIKKLSIEPVQIAETIKTFDQNLSAKWQHPEDFFNLLKSAYHRYILLNGFDLGTKVNLLDLLPEFVMLLQSKSFKVDPTKSNFSEYSRIQYSYDIYKLKTNPNLISNIQLSVATFAVTESKEKSIWIPDNEQGEGTYYHQIAFTK